MKYCGNCGQELADIANFCVNCGMAVEKNGESKQRKIVYEGELHKCPNCGELIDSFVSSCPSCGYELRGIKVANSVREFALKLEKIESERERIKPKSVFSSALTNCNISKTDEQKINLIRSFSIPNTKEDIYEFMILASSNIDLKLYGLGDRGVLTASQRAVSDAWMAKFEQAYEKARFALGKESEFEGIQNIYNAKMKQIKRAKLQVPMLITGIVGGIFLMIVVSLLLLI